MIKKLALLITTLISLSALIYQPLLTLIVYKSSLAFSHQLVQNYKDTLQENIQDLSLLIDKTNKTMPKCHPEQLWFTEYENSNIRLLGYEDLATKKLCWSQSFVNRSLINQVDVLYNHELDEQSKLQVIRLSEIESLIYYKKIKNRLWSATLEKNQAFDQACNDCYQIEWSNRPAFNTDYIANGEYQISTTVMHIPALFSINFGDITQYFKQKVQPWLISSLALFSLLIVGLFAYNIIGKRKLKTSLTQAIHNQQIQPFFQPIVDAKTQAVVAVEVLARWQVKDEYIPPSEFIEFAERSGLIDPMLLSLIQQTTTERRRFSSLFKNINFCFNVAPKQLERSQFTKKLLEVCKNAHSVEQPIAFEITEREAFNELEKAKKTLNQFTELGINMKLDDTGTGYGSFSYIQNLGFHAIKIDKMFIDTIVTNNVKRTVLDAIIEFGHTAELEMIAEGVETQAQVDYLLEHGINLHQGYYYAKPLAFDKLVQYVLQQASQA